jgi:hypothetical protein
MDRHDHGRQQDVGAAHPTYNDARRNRAHPTDDLPFTQKQVLKAAIGQREEPEVQRKAAAFNRWHEPDDARVSSPDCERLGVKLPGPTRQSLHCAGRRDGCPCRKLNLAGN